MKKIGISITLLFLVNFASAQNLQFGQVKIISNTDPPQLVPAGKVWKIEYCTPFKVAGGFDPPPCIALYLNGIALDASATTAIWLKENSVIQYKNSGFYTSTSALYQSQYYKALRSYALSIIEYNIIQ